MIRDPEVRGEIEIAEGRRVFAPGDEIAGTVTWQLPAPPEAAELRLHWRTEGKGTQDVEVVARESFDGPGDRDRRPFRFRLPEGPYSFSGKLISLVWGLELVTDPHRGSEEMLVLVEITVSPTGAELRLGSPDDATGVLP